MRKVFKVEKEKGITREDNACFGPTKIEFMMITFSFKGIPWYLFKLYSASHISSWTPEIPYNFGIKLNQTPAPQVFLWQKSKFNQVLISGNFVKVKIYLKKLYYSIHISSRTPPSLFVGSEKCKCFTHNYFRVYYFLKKLTLWFFKDWSK